MIIDESVAVQTERQSPSVLVVDDDPNISEIVALALEDSGYHVHQASDLSEAEQAYRDLRPDVVLCDLVLPDGLGSDLLRRLADQRKWHRPPTSILMSSHPDALRQAKRAHADAYLPKPFDLDELCSTVDRVLTKHRDS